MLSNLLATEDDRRAAMIVAAAGALYAVPLLLSHRPYVDDIGRALYGNGAWTSAGRPLADLFMTGFNLGSPIADLAPLTQIIGIGFICVSCFLLYRLTDGLRIPSGLRAVGCALFLFNPFLLENLAYRFDSLTQAVSVATALLAISIPTDRAVRATIGGAALVFISLCLYQVSVNLSLGGAVLLLVLSAERGDDSEAVLRSLAIRLLAIAAGLAVYMLAVIPLSGGGFYSPYADWHSDPIAINPDGLWQALKNLGVALDQVWNSFTAVQRLTAAVPAGLSIGYCLILAAKTFREPKQSWGRYPVALLVAFSPLLIVLGIFGVQIGLAHPVYHPRVYMGFGLAMVFALLLGLRGAAEAIDLVPKPVGRFLTQLLMALVLVPPAIPAITTTFAFGAAEVAQRDYEMLAAAEVRRGLAAIGARQPQIVIDGVVEYAPPVLPALERYPILRDLVVRSLDNDWFWGTQLLLYYGAAVDTKRVDRDAIMASVANLPVDYVGAGMTLTRVGDIVVIKFRK